MTRSKEYYYYELGLFVERASVKSAREYVPYAQAIDMLIKGKEHMWSPAVIQAAKWATGDPGEMFEVLEGELARQLDVT